MTATASARDHEFVAGLGASRVIDYAGGFADQVRDVDIVVDPVGGDAMAASWSVLRPGGRPDVTSVYFVVEPNGGQLRELASRIDDRTLHPVVSATFGLSDLAAAFSAGRDRRGPGKVVISVAPAQVR